MKINYLTDSQIPALHCFHAMLVFDMILEHLPESPEYFPKEKLTSSSARQFISSSAASFLFAR
jgi:GTPase Era involved in 16S rRNA processing